MKKYNINCKVLTALIIFICGFVNLNSKTDFQFDNLTILDTNNQFSKIWALNDNEYLLFDGNFLYQKDSNHDEILQVRIKKDDLGLKISTLQMNIFHDFLIQMNNNEIFIFSKDSVKKINYLFAETLKFSKISTDKNGLFYAYSSNKLFIINSQNLNVDFLTLPSDFNILDLVVDSQGTSWLLTNDKLYFSDDFIKFEEAKVNNIEIFRPSQIFQSTSGKLYATMDKMGVFIKNPNENEFNFHSFNIPRGSASALNKYSLKEFAHGYVQLIHTDNNYYESFIFDEINFEWIYLPKNYANYICNDVMYHSFPSKQKHFQTFNSLSIQSDNINPWVKDGIFERLDFREIYQLMKIKENLENNEFYTFHPNNYYCRWNYESGMPIAKKLLPIKNKVFEDDLISKKIYFTNDWKYYFYLRLAKNVKYYHIELYNLSNDSLIREFEIDNSETPRNFPVGSGVYNVYYFIPNPKAVYYPEKEDFFISFRIDESGGHSNAGGNKGFGGFYHVKIKPNETYVNKISNSFTADFMVDYETNRIFYTNHDFDYDYYQPNGGAGETEFRWYSKIFEYNMQKSEYSLLLDTNVIAGTTLKYNQDKSALITNLGSDIIEINSNKEINMKNKFQGKEFINAEFLYNDDFVFYKDRIYDMFINEGNAGSLNIYNIIFGKSVLKFGLENHFLYNYDFSVSENTLLLTNNAGKIFRFRLDYNLKEKADFICKNGYVNQNIEFKAVSTLDNSKFLWHFGDGTFSDFKNPVKSFNEKGNYDISLKVFNNSDTLLIEKLGCVSIYDSTKINFSADVTFGYSPLNVNFTSSTSGEILQYRWIVYVDSLNQHRTFSEQEHSSYSFTFPGTYSIRFEVRDKTDNWVTLFKEAYINVLVPSSIEEITNKSNQLILNATKNNMYIKHSNIKDNNYQIIIFDLLGNIVKKIDSKLFSANSDTIEIKFDNSLSNGVYIVNLLFFDRVISGKFIIID
ncbi:MAG: PKD domain-containing protein [Candidatus Kapabacteria bacterium]|nr:PKD domain-containing protein [Ignavibacteriota bacterium]MCW5886080.1 PKD domain-containing protein [Candidatus Kapabacteria bacterium]